MMAFHQGSLHVLHHHAAKLPILVEVFGPFPLAFGFGPVPPYGIPLLAVQGFWGGAWGVLIAALIRLTLMGSLDLPLGLVFGAVAITAVETTTLPGFIGLPRLATGDEQALLRAALLNGAFGFGTAFLLRPFAMRG